MPNSPSGGKRVWETKLEKSDTLAVRDTCGIAADQTTLPATCTFYGTFC